MKLNALSGSDFLINSNRQGLMKLCNDEKAYFNYK